MTYLQECVAQLQFLWAITYSHKCPSCFTEWSERECEIMLEARSCTCICGYHMQLEELDGY